MKMFGYIVLGSAATLFIQYMIYNKDTCQTAFDKIQKENNKAMCWMKNKFK